MHWLLFIHKILFSSTCFKPQVLIFRRIQLYTCSIWHCHSLREFVVAGRYTAWVLTQAVYRQATKNSRREWHCHMLQVYNCILLKMSTWGSKHVKENNTLWINNNQCIKLVINVQSIHDARSEKQVSPIVIKMRLERHVARERIDCNIMLWKKPCGKIIHGRSWVIFRDNIKTELNETGSEGVMNLSG